MNKGPSKTSKRDAAAWIERYGVENEDAIGGVVLFGVDLTMQLAPMRHCERCTKVRFVGNMRYIRRPLGGRAYWICRSCRHKWRGKSVPPIRRMAR